MRKLMPVFGIGAATALLAGCASNSPSPSAAGAAGTSVTTATGQPASTSASPAGSSSDSPSTTSPSASSTPSTAKKPSGTPTAKPSTQHPTPTTAAKPTPTHTATPAHTSTPTSPTTPGSAPTSFGYQPDADAKAQIDAARAAAKADGKEVLLDFGASWCGNCVAMDRAFHTSQVQAELAASYHLVQIDADTNMSAISPYDDSSGFGLPVLIILSPSGSVRVDTNKTGNPSFSQSGFLAFLKKWAA